jgi:4-hydroxy-3-methylbut-2-enyl diphosphate reductase
MEIIVGKKAGFCFGVKRAINITSDLTKEADKGIYTFGPLIHNPQVVEKLAAQGVSPTNDIYSPEIRTLVIRTHGVPPKIYAEVSKMPYRLVDATCPFVKKAQRFAKALKDEGYQVVIVGDREHPEVQGLIGFAGEDVITVNSAEALPPLKRKVGIIVQTTQPFDTFEKVVLQVINLAREVKIYNTICDYTIMRIKETKEIAKKVDLMIIVGGKNSANTTQLFNLSRQICNKVFHIEASDELKEEWFETVKKVGITGGASTPQWIIEEVVKKVREISIRR